MTDDIKIAKLLPSHAEDVAKLHILGIHTGFISSLGLGFVTALYEAIATTESGFGFVAVKESRVVGYVAFTTNVGALYKSVIRKRGLKLSFVLARKMFSLDTIRKVSETLFYPKRIKKLDLPSAELLSISIDPDMRSSGLATNLVYRGVQECLERKIEKVKVLVGSENIPANKFYVKYGFEFVKQIDNHGILSTIYVADSNVCKEILHEKIKGAPLELIAEEVARPSVFITYGWCRSSYAAVQSLGKRGVDVHVGDASTFAMSRYSRYCKSFTKLPDFFLEPDKYFESICQALKKTGAKVLLPCHEDVGIFTHNRHLLPDDVCVAVPNSETYDLAEDKYKFLKIAEESGCPYPNTLEVSSDAELKSLQVEDFPVVIKTRTGNSAKGVRLADNKKDFLEKFDDLVQTFNLSESRWPVVQEFLPGEAVGVCLLYEHGQCKVSFAERYLRCKEPNRFGTSTLREVFENKELIDHAIAVMDRLQWHGVAHLDFVADKDGVFKLIEINPRLWGALSLSVVAGIDFPYYWYLSAVGKLNDIESHLVDRKAKSRWLIGDCLAFFELVKRARFVDAIKIMKFEKCHHDDFSLKDPVPFMFEIIDYLIKFVKAGFSTNPVTGNMIR